MKKILGVIEGLLDDGVLILSQDVDNLNTLLTNYPDLITDIIKVHEFLKDKEYVNGEFIYPADDEVMYEIFTSQEGFIPLIISLNALELRSENLIISIAPYTEVEDD
ncbi:MAG: hypothetical protein P3W91_001120 [Fervidobacterium sp.]|nr:hypothetical protein [Fervidobacterium sp.]